MGENISRNLYRRVPKFIIATVITFVLVLVGYIYWIEYVCDREAVYSRPQPVNADPLFSVDIPADVDVRLWEVSSYTYPDDLYWEVKHEPLGRSGADTFLKRFESIDDAREEFVGLCNNGWPDKYERNQNRFRKLVIYGGEQDNRYCASGIVEWRFASDNFCFLSGEYVSYVIFQKGEVLIAIYENQNRGHEFRNVGSYTNDAIKLLAGRILEQ